MRVKLMDGMDGEIISHRRPFVILLVIAIVLMVAIIWIGNWALKQQTPSGVEGRPGLTAAQRAEIQKSLQALPSAKPLTAAQKSEIQKSLQAPPNTPPLTAAQTAEILKSLK